jgi:hypothetical protein
VADEDKVDFELVICRVGTLDNEKFEFKKLDKRTWGSHLYKMSKTSSGKPIYIYELKDGSLSIEFEWDDSKAAPFTRVHHITGITKWDMIPKSEVPRPKRVIPPYLKLVRNTTEPETSI